MLVVSLCSGWKWNDINQVIRYIKAPLNLSGLLLSIHLTAGSTKTKLKAHRKMNKSEKTIFSTHFMLLVSFCNPWKHQKTFGFQGYKKSLVVRNRLINQNVSDVFSGYRKRLVAINELTSCCFNFYSFLDVLLFLFWLKLQLDSFAIEAHWDSTGPWYILLFDLCQFNLNRICSLFQNQLVNNRH